MKNSSENIISPGQLATLSLWFAVILFCLLSRKDLTVDNIVRFTPGHRTLAALTMLALFGLKGASVGLSGNILYMADGVMFALPEAVALNVLGTALMTAIPYFLGRRAGAGMLDKLTSRYRKLELLREAPCRSGFLLTLFLRTLGLLPCEPVGLYLGACGVRFGDYMKGTLLGLFPAAVAFAVMGEYLSEPLSPPFLAAAGIQTGTSLCTVAAVIFRRRKQKQKQERNRPCEKSTFS